MCFAFDVASSQWESATEALLISYSWPPHASLANALDAVEVTLLGNRGRPPSSCPDDGARCCCCFSFSLFSAARDPPQSPLVKKKDLKKTCRPSHPIFLKIRRVVGFVFFFSPLTIAVIEMIINPIKREPAESRCSYTTPRTNEKKIGKTPRGIFVPSSENQTTSLKEKKATSVHIHTPADWIFSI